MAYASRYTSQALALGLTPMSYADKQKADKEAKEAGERAARAYASAYESELRSQQQEFRSLVEGVLQPTQVSDLDMARTRLGTYTDQWDEYIRRIRSAATDSKSAWKDLIPTDVLAQGSDAVKVWVAEQERLFYSGQMTGQINWDAVLADIQRQVQEKAAREALVNEAVQRAAAAGLGVSRSEVAQALGVQDPGAAGLETAQSFAAGLTKADQAATLTASFEQDLQGQQEKWVALGALAVGWWATGVKKGGASVARDMAMLLAPYLQTALAERSPYP
jgi:hypothetical protein